MTPDTATPIPPQEQTAVTAKPEPFFPDVFEDQKDLQDIASSMDVARLMYAIRAVAREKATYEQQLKEAVEFYQNRIEGCDKQIAFIEKKIETFLVETGKTKVVTHVGTAYMQEHRMVTWPEPDRLLAWAKETDPASLVRIKEEPNKTAIKAYIEESGATPPGYSEVVVPTLRTRGIT